MALLSALYTPPADWVLADETAYTPTGRAEKRLTGQIRRAANFGLGIVALESISRYSMESDCFSSFEVVLRVEGPVNIDILCGMGLDFEAPALW